MKIELNFSISEMTEFLSKEGYCFDMICDPNFRRAEGNNMSTLFKTIAYKSDDGNPIIYSEESMSSISKKYDMKIQFEKELKLKLLNLN